MSTPKGFPGQEKDQRVGAQHCTVEPLGPSQYGLTVVGAGFNVLVGADAVEASSTTSIINATAHAAVKGDIISFTSGVFSGREIRVHSIPSANEIELAETLSAAPSAADTFNVLRPKAALVNADGTLPGGGGGAADLTYLRDAVSTNVSEDTGTPANSRPLPVKLVAASGDITVTAANLDVQLTHTGATPDSIQLGDGTDLLAITAAGEATVSLTTALPAGTNNIGDVDVVSSVLPTGAATAALQTQPGVDIGDVTINNAAGAAAVNIQDGGNSITVDGPLTDTELRATAVPVSAASLPLPTGASTAANQATANASLSSIDGGIPAALGQTTMAASMPVAIASDQSTLPISAASLPLPTGAATAANQATANASLSSIDDGIPAALGQAAMAASMPVVIASDQSVLSVTPTALDVVDFMDTPLLDASSTNIPASASAPVTVVASLAAAVRKVQVLDTTGGYVGLYSDPAGTPVLEAIIGPGSDSTIEVSLAATTVLGLRNMENAAISVGNVAINFIG